MAQPISDFGRVLRKLFTFAKYVSYGLTGLMLVFLAFRVAEIYEFFRDIHPAAGYAFLVVFAVLAYVLVGRPIRRFLAVPVAMKPPALAPMDERTGKDLGKHLAFVARYVRSLPRNPMWEGSPSDVEAVVARCLALKERAEHLDNDGVTALRAEIKELEEKDVARLLEPLDRKANETIRKEALGVGIATAVSWNGTVDAFLVLWRNCNLVSRIASIYYGRPGVRGTFSILRDVSGATIASAYLQDLSDMAGEALGSLFGKSLGAFAGPVLEGGINAVATLRIGYVAKARCRAFDAWTEKTRMEFARSAIVEAGRISKSVFTEVVKTVGGGVFKVPAAALTKLGDAIGKFWNNLGKEKPEADAATA